jgi:GT2 family glycosyltransferase
MTAALFRSALFNDIGPLDESFGSYLEDVDFGLRCAFAGRAGVYVPQAISHHVGSATMGEWSKDTVRRIARNQVLLAKKHFRGMPLWRILAGQLLWGFVTLRHGRGLSYSQGKVQGLLTRPEGRRSRPANAKSILEDSERQIFDFQQQTGFDRYWRAYFWLSRR